MIAWILAIGVLASEPPSSTRQVEAVLRMDPELKAIHRGYVVFLQRHPDLASAERALNRLRDDEAFRRAAAPFEEWLLRNPDALRAHLDYVTAFSARPELVDALRTVEQVQDDLAPGLSPPSALPMDFVGLLNVLRTPGDLTAVPGDLLPYVIRLRNDPALRETLFNALETIVEAPQVEMWRAILEPSEEASIAQEFAQYAVANPERGARWQERALAFGSRPHEFAWLAYWHGRVRREPRLGNYYAYLESIWEAQFAGTGPDADRDADVDEEPFEGLDALSWPPDGDPPALPPLDDALPTLDPPRVPVSPRIATPERPTIAAPTPPTLPAAPARPHVPMPTPRRGR